MSRAALFGTATDHFTTANRKVSVIVQIETQAALGELEAIAAEEGVDALFMGPADLSGSLGHPGELTHPDVMALMAECARRAQAVGKAIGTVGGTPEVVTRYRAMGYDYVAVASDLGLLMRGAQAAVQALRTETSQPHVHTLHQGTHTETGY